MQLVHWVAMDGSKENSLSSAHTYSTASPVSFEYHMQIMQPVPSDVVGAGVWWRYLTLDKKE